MPDAAPETQSPPTATVVADRSTATSSESTAAPADRPQVGSPTSFDAIFAQALAGIPQDDPSGTTALSEDTQPTDSTPATATDAKATPSDDAGVTASEEAPGEGADAPPEPGKPLSRRAQIAADKDAEIARLTALVAERDPEAIKQTLREQVRADLEAETRQRATSVADEDFLGNQARYERLLTTPIGELSAEDYDWREERTERRAKYAPVERHIRSIYEQRLAAIRASDQQQVSGHQEAILGGIGAEIADMAALPGVDSSDWKTPGRTFRDYGRALYDGGAANKEAEMSARVEKAETEAARLTKDNEDLRLELLGSTPAPVTGGRSASGQPVKPTADPNGTWQDNLGAAFGWTTTH